jgi:hypothetical protein
MTDDYGDGWLDGDDAQFYIKVYQGTTLRGSVSLADGFSGSQTVSICTGDSIRFVMDGEDYYSESSFVILNGDGSTILSGDCSDYYDGDVIITVAPACPSCPAPTDLNTIISSDEIEFSWTPSGTESSWIVSNGLTSVTVTDTFYTFSNLSANTNYTLSVAALCGSDDTSAAVTITVLTTPGDPIADFPFLCTFESSDTNAQWVIMNGTLTNQWYIGSATNNGGDSALYISSDNGATNSYTISSSSNVWAYVNLNLTAGQYGISFDWRAYGESCCDYLRAYLIPATSEVTPSESLVTPTGATQLTNNMNVSSSWQNFTTVFSVASDASYKLAFLWHNDGSVGTMPPAAIDNLLITRIECPQPTVVVVDSSTTESITLHWNHGGDESAWNIVLNDSIVANVTDTSYTITDLEPSTQYSIGVYAVCGDDDTSFVTYTTARTACGQIASLPYIQNFNNCPTGSSVKFDPCWAIYNNYSTASNYPYVSSGYLYMYLYSSTSSNINNMFGYAMLPELSDDLATTDMELSFKIWGSSTSTYASGVIVAAFDSVTLGMPTFDTIAIIVPTATSQAAAETYYVSIVDQDLTGKRLGFFFANQKASVTSSYYYYTYIDDVNLHEAPNCLVPQDFAVDPSNADSILLTWNGPEDASDWQIAIGNYGFNPDTVSSYISASDTFLYVENLTSGVSYDAYLRTDCGNDEYSMWIGPVTFMPGIITMPVTGTHTMSVCDAVIYDDGGATGNYSTSCQATLTLYPSDSTKRFFIWGSGYTESCCDYLRVYSGATATGTLLASIQGTATIDTVKTMGGPITLVFHSDGSVQYTGFELHLACVDLPSCLDIDEVTVNDVTTSSAFVTWTNVTGTLDAPDSYNVVVIDTNNTTVFSNTVNDMYAIVSGLQPNSDYTVVVTPDCSNAAGAATFTTRDFSCLVFNTNNTFFDTVTGTSATSYQRPLNNFYRNTFSEQIYDSTELAGSGPIVNFSLHYSYSSPMTSKNNVSVYMANTTLSSISTTNYITPDQMTLVYSGSLNCSQGWNEFALDVPFNYSGENLAVAFVDNSNAYDGSAYVWYGHSASGKAFSWYSDTYTYPNSSMSSNTDGFRPDMAFSIIACDQQATCSDPLLVVTGKSAYTIDAIWAAGASETTWTVQHKVANSNSWVTDLANTTLTSTTINNLTPNTEYNVRVFTICGTDTFATVRTVITDCIGEALPFSEDFSAWTTGTSASIPGCWFKGSSYSASYPYVSTSYSMGDGKSMYFYASGTTYTYLALPKMEAPLDTLVLTGYVYYSSSDYLLNVGYMTDANDYSTFHTVSAIPTVASQWTPFEVTFVGAPDANIAFSTGNGGSYVYLYLDNIEVNYYNPCIRPTNVNANNITTNSANISWVDTAAADFEVEYGPAGFEHGQGTVLYVSDTHAVLSNLNHSSNYSVYVRGICGPGDTSNWSFVYNFATQCHAIDVLPHYEDFNNWGYGNSMFHAPNCWTYGSDYSTTYPYMNTVVSTGHGGAMYLYNYDYDHVGNITWFALPEIDPTVAAANQTQVVFSVYTSTSSYSHPVMVGVSTSPSYAGATWIDTVFATYNVWEEYEVAFDSYTDTGRYIIFASYVDGDYNYSYPYVDDITLELIPSCQRPDNLTAGNSTQNSVELAWHERSNASNWIIEYGPIGFELGTGTIVAANSNPFTLTGLPVAYQGEYYVRSVCSSTDSSNYSRRPCPFATSQIPATIPYNYNFENDAEWANWQTSTNHSTNWFRGTAANTNGNNSQYSMYVSADNGTTYRPYLDTAIVNAAVYRDIDFGNVDSSFTLSFDARVGGTTTGAYDGLMVFLVDPSVPTIPSNSGITSPWGNVNDLYRITFARLDTNWNTYTASFDTISGIKRVAFFWFNQNTPTYTTMPEPAAVDNIHIDYSACPRPIAVTVHPNSTSAVVSWQGPASASYQVIYRPYPEGTTNTFVNTNNNFITLSGLEPTTQYAIWVRKLCGNDTSLTSDGILFTTTFCDGATTFYNYNDTLQNSSTSSYSPIGYSLYDYSYVQTIVDSAYLAGLEGMDIAAFAFNPASTSAGTYFTNMTVWMANVADSNLSSGFIHPDDSAHIFYKVIDSADFSYTATGWQMHVMDTIFTWDGHSNILVSVKRDHGDWTSGSSFKAHTASASKSRYVYRDGTPYDHETVTGGTATSTVGDLMFVSCGGSCQVPAALPATNVTYNAATINWSSLGTEFEVSYKAVTDAVWATDVTVNNAYTYNITGLTPNTQYQFRVRNICDSETMSDYAYGTFTTSELPCFVPENLSVTATGYTTATLAWEADESQNQWSILIWDVNESREVEVSSNPATVTGLLSAHTYYATIKAICGNGAAESEYGDTVQFTTATCAQVTGVNANNVTATTATLSWNPTGANNYRIEYGEIGFAQGEGISVEVSGTTHTLTGLSSETQYTAYVRAICETGVEGDWSAAVDFETSPEGISTVDGNMTLSIYPNPTTNATTISLSGVNGDVSIVIVDMNGRIVKSDTMSCEGDCTKHMEVSGLAQGAYFVRVSGDGVSQVRKLVVK